ncbi:hypothetical protein A2X44_00390 [candidate division CPR3 bacterium GWF2_35_18]|nr:MAG: hypothetical protein A2X44_00390 [candidate division CPR3 bacterium GWF2_35_18]OGB64883.1 MAG: hypothetical protein A2250_05640 [candidate division CPR3 bacterium RIFOXYA2_FULL_35_13]OGB77054.1 MAG: hypothetical protein A2476_02945 [candidate division CPR3 bacterium RIFOXYC2_FULL_35_7]OGB80473.1 MAG: hypothetical protein A2011_00435 [candidate division CPR3 bacterium GWE2_35_7]
MFLVTTCCFLVIRGLNLIKDTVNIGATYAESLPQPRIEERSGEPSKIYDRNGNFLYEIHGNIRQKNVNLSEVPLYVQQAFIAAEDHEFYTHSGVSLKNIIASIKENLSNEEVERGASTIPMQLSRNLVLTNDKTIERKLKEIIIAILINTRYSKDQILERYLNEVPVGGNLVGIATAAEVYFQKEVKDLSLAEGTTIAALINAPSRLSPYNAETNLKERTDIILDQMVDLDYITKSSSDEAKRQKLTFAADIETIKYPHFIMYVKKLLEDKYGKEKIEYGGYKIYTTIDPDLQNLAEQKIKEAKDINTNKWLARDAGIVVMDPKTGQILAMVGSYDYFETQVNIITSKRQPGSSFKPFVYLTAFENGYSDKTIVLDSVRDFGGGYKPEDYGGGATGQWLTIRQTLIRSLNIPAVATLNKIGVTETTQRIKDLGFMSLDPNVYYGLSMALGSVEVTPLEMVTGASLLATGGKEVIPVSILKIEKEDGNLLMSNEWIKSEKQIADSNAVALVNNILSDYQTKQAFYNSSWFRNYSLSDRPAAAKTGTTSGPKDVWLMGYTPNLASVVWSGNNDGSLLKNDADGINVAAPIWDSFMEEAVKKYPIEEFTKPIEVTLNNDHKYIGL